ncbi:hypothetical protein HQN87_09795 [Paenibacillus tritici]|uniref:Small, acid-soluble spore protein, alpha/beta type n=1 Tax=Paenibacillus tritici TaxID=1873425 RepID=A0ABX2DQ94_9BACL|nr:hypothetical protein [Paenibacillus tritici]NQX45621.1 hypothetical protein [Paenibacillus tritici]
MKKKINLDDAARRFAGGHYVEQSMPGANPERDKMVSDAIAKLKQGQSATKVRQ